MNKNKIEMALGNITVGVTTALNGHVVTRWNMNRYEVDTCNRPGCSFDEAVEAVSLRADSPLAVWSNQKILGGGNRQAHGGDWNTQMPCGHLRQFGTLGDVFPVHCLACENEQLRQKLKATKRYLRAANKGAERNSLVAQLSALRNVKLAAETESLRKPNAPDCSTAPTRKVEIEIEWQHEETGARFTKRIPEGGAIPAFPRRNIIAWRVL